ncbi:hypothetical protein MIR68_000894, partial [Amoeboaphelidium protococcarum]
MSSNFQQQQQSMSSPLVWFMLLDSVTGEPYRDSSVTSV